MMRIPRSCGEGFICDKNICLKAHPDLSTSACNQTRFIDGERPLMAPCHWHAPALSDDIDKSNKDMCFGDFLMNGFERPRQTVYVLDHCFTGVKYHCEAICGDLT
jgi:hypothetical protein